MLILMASEDFPIAAEVSSGGLVVMVRLLFILFYFHL